MKVHLALLFVLALDCISIECLAQYMDAAITDKWVQEATQRAELLRTGVQGADMGPALFFTDCKGVRLPYLVRVPRTYSRDRKYPVVVFLHGASLAKDSFQYTDPLIADEPVFSAADSLQAIVIFPFARAGFKWSGDPQVFQCLQHMLEEALQTVSADHSRVFLCGQSMGGNAVLWFIRNQPGGFAGFATFSANPGPQDAVAIGRLPRSSRVVSLHAADDVVFPYAGVAAVAGDIVSRPVQWDFRTIPKGGHRFIYQPGGGQYIRSALLELLGAGAIPASK